MADLLSFFRKLQQNGRKYCTCLSSEDTEKICWMVWIYFIHPRHSQSNETEPKLDRAQSNLIGRIIVRLVR